MGNNHPRYSGFPTFTLENDDWHIGFKPTTRDNISSVLVIGFNAPQEVVDELNFQGRTFLGKAFGSSGNPYTHDWIRGELIKHFNGTAEERARALSYAEQFPGRRFNITERYEPGDRVQTHFGVGLVIETTPQRAKVFLLKNGQERTYRHNEKNVEL